ncbi:MFS transporter [Miltoncostaea oceani]|uniref:MFS transporter n=1 Tax=Miltoncostaea oceani TaxID=2843216 RepID=UPI001C3E77C6|nr:MFS transporter [Miltoncostaea oceani]
MSGSTPSLAASRTRRPPRPGLLLLALTVAGGSFALMQAVVVPALPELQRDLDSTTAWVAWTVSIYLLSASVATPLLGRLGDQYGKDRMLLVTLAIFTVGSILSIFAWDITSLIVFRAIQGVGGAVYPLCFSIIRDEMPPKRMGVAMGLISAMLGVGGGLGLVMSGIIVDNGSWRILFVVGAVIGLIAMGLVRAAVPPSPSRARASLDIPGALLLSAGLICVLVALTESRSWGWGSPLQMSVLGAGLVILVLWGWIESRTAQPLVDMRMMARRPVLFTNLAALFCGFTMYAIFTVLPLFAQMPSGLPVDAQALVTYGFGASVTVSALYLIPGALVMLPAGPYGGVLGRQIGFKYALAIGLLVTAIGSAMLAAIHAEPWQLMLGYAVGAAGVAVAFGAMPKLIADAVSPTETGIATGMNTVVRTVGSAIGAQAAITLLASDTIAGTDIPAEGGFSTSLWLGAAAALVAALLALGISPRRRVPREAVAASRG